MAQTTSGWSRATSRYGQARSRISPFPGAGCGVGEFGVEVHFGEQVDDPVCRFVRGGGLLVAGIRLVAQSRPAFSARRRRARGVGPRLAASRAARGRYPSGEASSVRMAVHGAGSSGGGPRRFLRGDLAGSGQHVQVEPDGGDVQAGRGGEFVDVQGGVAAAQQFQQPPPGFGRGGVGRCRRQGCPGYRSCAQRWVAGDQRGVHTDAADLRRAAGGCDRMVAAGNGSVKNRALSSVNTVHRSGTSSS